MVKIWGIELIKMKFKGIASYKVELVSNFVWVLIFIFINYFVWSAFKRDADIIGYVLTIAITSSISFRSAIAYVLRKYRSGAIVFDLIRPKRYKRIVFWNWIGGIVRHNLFIVPIIVFAFLLKPNLIFFTSIFLAGYLRFLVGFVMATIFYESYYDWGVSELVGTLAYITGGGIPYFLMPNIVKEILILNPLFYMVAAPWVAVRDIFIIIYQVIIIAIFSLIAYLLERRMLNKLTTVGV